MVVHLSGFILFILISDFFLVCFIRVKIMRTHPKTEIKSINIMIVTLISIAWDWRDSTCLDVFLMSDRFSVGNARDGSRDVAAIFVKMK